MATIDNTINGFKDKLKTHIGELNNILTQINNEAQAVTEGDATTVNGFKASVSEAISEAMHRLNDAGTKLTTGGARRKSRKGGRKLKNRSSKSKK